MTTTRQVQEVIMRKDRAIGYILAILLALPQVALAQTSTEPNREWSAFKNLQSREKLVARLKDGKTLEGRLSNVSETVLTLSNHGKPIDLDRRDIVQVYRVTGTPVKKPVLIGLALGAVVGAGAGTNASKCNPGSIVCFDRSETIPIGAVFGASVGALIGFGIGKTRHKRVLIYEARWP
jgi:uncharacterized protein YcfJ